MIRRSLKSAGARLGGTPFKSLLANYYRAGLALVLRQLSALPEVASVYGCGSFFDGTCLYGRSDIDLVVVIRPEFSRRDPVDSKLSALHRRTKLVFPFIDNWAEQELSILYLDEHSRGEPLPASFVVRAQQGALTHLYGDRRVEQFVPQDISTAAVLEEIGGLLRLVLTRGETYACDGYFWQRVFSKLSKYRKLLGLSDIQWVGELSFCSAGPAAALGTSVDPAPLFDRLTEEVLKTGSELAAQSETCCAEASIPANAGEALELPAHLAAGPAKVLEQAGLLPETTAVARPFLLGPEPELLFFDPDRPMALLDLPRGGYRAVRRLLQAMKRRGSRGDALLVDAGGLLVLLHREIEGTTIVPLHPLLYPLAYCERYGITSIAIPQKVYEERRERERRRSALLAGQYRKAARWIEKHSYPCVYIEDEYTTFRDAFYIWRKRLFAATGHDCRTLEELIAVLAERYPEAGEPLAAVLQRYRFLSGAGPEGAPANNLYRVVHELTAQLLEGAGRLELSPLHRSLAMTVGIVTRNRAGLLREALLSLAGQRRKPDEVLVVDNGSTDGTKDCIESFRGSLPIRSCFLRQPSIPLARNYVIEQAKGDVVCFTDDDCIADDRWLESVERAFLRADNVGLVGGWVYHHPAAQTSALDTYYQIFHHRKP